MTRPVVVGLTGPAGCGKSTVARWLRADHGFVELSFAAPIRELVMDALGWSDEELEAGKEQVTRYGVTPRQMMQTLGTEWGRNMIHPDFWVLWLERRLSCFPGKDRFVVSDVRFPNEASWVRTRGTLWHLTRPGTTVSAHISEAGVERTPPDRGLDNDCDLDALRGRIANLLGWMPTSAN